MSGRPMKLTDVGQDEATLNRYIDDDEWVMQQKFDGARCMLVWDLAAGTCLFTNDGETEIRFAAARQHLLTLQVEAARLMGQLGWEKARFDGELIVETGEYYVFDVLEAYAGDGPLSPQELIEPDDPLHWRLMVLTRIGLGTEHIHQTPTAHASYDKRTLWERVVEAGVEGAVSKHRDSVYEYDVRSKEWVKHKLVKTADVEVIKTYRTYKPSGIVETGSAVLAVRIRPEQDPKPWVRRTKRLTGDERLALGRSTAMECRYDPRSSLVVGNASLIGKDLEIVKGSVVEVNYLYWTGDAMIQPRIVWRREDKTAEECGIDQFAPYTRKLAWS